MLPVQKMFRSIRALNHLLSVGIRFRILTPYEYALTGNIGALNHATINLLKTELKHYLYEAIDNNGGYPIEVQEACEFDEKRWRKYRVLKEAYCLSCWKNPIHSAILDSKDESVIGRLTDAEFSQYVNIITGVFGPVAEYKTIGDELVF